MKKKAISLLLAVLMLVSLVPSFAVAEETEHVHEYVYVQELPATAEAEGMKEHYICSGCEELFLLVEGQYLLVTAAELVIPKLEAPAQEEPAPAPAEADAQAEEPGAELLTAEPDAEEGALLTSEGAVASGSCGDNITWELSAEGVLTLTGSGEMPNYTSSDPGQAPWNQYAESISSVSFKGNITGIGDCAFYGLSQLESIVIPAGVTGLGANAFENCTGLKAVTLHDGITTMGDAAFKGCTALESIAIPTGLTEIGMSAFSACKSLTVLVIPDNIKIINGSAFRSCEKLQSVTIGNGVESIGNGAFEYCYALADVTIGSSVNSIHPQAFSECSALQAFTLDSGNSAFSVEDGVLYDKAQTRALICPCGKTGTHTIPDSVTSIGERAFRLCNLSTVAMGSGVKTIGEYAFAESPNLTGVSMPAGLTDIGERAFYRCLKLEGVQLPEALESIGDYAFYECNIEKIVIPDTVSYLGSSAFSWCKNLTNITIGKGISSISDGTFTGCSALNRIVLPCGITSIGSNAFYGCSTLMYVQITYTVASIGENAFKDCTNLYNVYFLGIASQWDMLKPNIAQEGNDALLNTTPRFEFKDGGYLSSGVFWGFIRIGTLHFGGTGEIPDFSSKGAPWHEYVANIYKVEFVGEITKIGSYAFEDLTDVNKVIFPGSEADWLQLQATAGEGNEQFFLNYSRANAVSISLETEYLVMTEGDEYGIKVTVSPKDLENELVWSSSAPEVATVDQTGLVTALAEGCAEIRATATRNGKDYAAVCRIDVTDQPTALEVAKVNLVSAKATSKLYSTDYTIISIQLELEQNAPLAVGGGRVKDRGWAIEKAEFENAEAAKYFILVPADDRSLVVMPTEEALAPENLKYIASKYKSAIKITLASESGECSPLTSETALTLTVDKKLPKVTVKGVTLNSTYPRDVAELSFSGGIVKRAVLAEHPEGVSLADNTRLTVQLVNEETDAPITPPSKLNLLVMLQGWNYNFPVTLSLKTKAAKPSLALKAVGGIDTAVANSSLTVTATLKNNVGKPVYNYFIKDALGNDYGPESFNLTENDGVITLTQNDPNLQPGTYFLTVVADDYEFNNIQGMPPLPGAIDAVVKDLKFTVKATAPEKLKPSVTLKASGTIDVLRPNSAVTLSLSFKDWASYNSDRADIAIYEQSGKNTQQLSGTGNPFYVEASGNGFKVSVRPGFSPNVKSKYFAVFSDSVSGLTSKQVKLNVKLGKGKVTADTTELTFLKNDRHSSGVINLTPEADLSIAKVEINGKDANLLELTELGTNGTRWQLAYKGNAVTFTKTKTVTLNLWFKGADLNGKASATLKVKINVA